MVVEELSTIRNIYLGLHRTKVMNRRVLYYLCCLPPYLKGIWIAGIGQMDKMLIHITAPLASHTKKKCPICKVTLV